MNLQMLAIVIEHADYMQLSSIRTQLLDEIASGHCDDDYCIDALFLVNHAMEKEIKIFRNLMLY